MKTVRTAAQILTMFDTDTPSVTVSAACARLGLSPSASSRLLAALATSGIIQRQPDRSYRPGPLAYRLGLLYHAHNRLTDHINDGARKIVALARRTCWISVLSDTNSMLISRFPGPEEQGFHIDPGNLVPAHASAGGKALLARLPEADLRKLLTVRNLDAWTEKSKTEVSAVLSDIALIRERGWSIIVDELFLGIISVGVAFAPPMEATPMALSISIPSASLSDVAQGVQMLVAVACEIGHAVGDPFWTTRPSDLDLQSILSDIKNYVSVPKLGEQT